MTVIAVTSNGWVVFLFASNGLQVLLRRLFAREHLEERNFSLAFIVRRPIMSLFVPRSVSR